MIGYRLVLRDNKSPALWEQELLSYVDLIHSLLYANCTASRHKTDPHRSFTCNVIIPLIYGGKTDLINSRNLFFRFW